MDEIASDLRDLRDNQGSFIASTEMKLTHHNELLESFSQKTFVEIHAKINTLFNKLEEKEFLYDLSHQVNAFEMRYNSDYAQMKADFAAINAKIQSTTESSSYTTNNQLDQIKIQLN